MKSLDAFECKAAIDKVRPMGSCIIIRQYADVFELWSLLGNMWMQPFKHISIVFLVYSILHCCVALINKATAIEECDRHHLSHCKLLSDFVLHRKRLAHPMCTFLPSEGLKILHLTFVAHLHCVCTLNDYITLTK